MEFCKDNAAQVKAVYSRVGIPSTITRHSSQRININSVSSFAFFSKSAAYCSILHFSMSTPRSRADRRNIFQPLFPPPGGGDWLTMVGIMYSSMPTACRLMTHRPMVNCIKTAPFGGKVVSGGANAEMVPYGRGTEPGAEGALFRAYITETRSHNLRMAVCWQPGERLVPHLLPVRSRSALLPLWESGFCI